MELLESSNSENREWLSAVLGNFGLVLQTIGDHAAAKQYLQKALQLDIQLFGSDHLNVAIALGNLGDEYRSIGEYGQALPLYERALEIRRSAM